MEAKLKLSWVLMCREPCFKFLLNIAFDQPLTELYSCICPLLFAYAVFGVSCYVLWSPVGSFRSIRAFSFNQLTMSNCSCGFLVWCGSQQSNNLTDACACSFSVSEVLFWDGCVMMATVGGICDIGLWNSLSHISVCLSPFPILMPSEPWAQFMRDLWL